MKINPKFQALNPKLALFKTLGFGICLEIRISDLEFNL